MARKNKNKYSAHVSNATKAIKFAIKKSDEKKVKTALVMAGYPYRTQSLEYGMILHIEVAFDKHAIHVRKLQKVMQDLSVPFNLRT